MFSRDMTSVYLPSKDVTKEEEYIEETKHKYDLVKIYKKLLKKPKFFVKKIKERDCPIYERWCSVVNSKNVDCFLETYVQRAKKKGVDPFTMLNEISIVFPTVNTMDMFQLLNGKKSYKDERLQWTGYSETYSKIWSEIDLEKFVLNIALQMFFSRFDEMSSLVKLFDDIDAMYAKTDDPADEERFFRNAETLKHAVYSAWFKRVQESVSSLGDFDFIQRAMYLMFGYKQSMGIVPYQQVENGKGTNSWINPIRKIPDPFNIILVKNARDNSYACWNFKTNTKVDILFDKFGIPFNTKLNQLLKAEYTFAELFIKQNGDHLSDGYILAEKKEEDSATKEEEERESKLAQRDKEDEEAWRRQLETLDEKVKYEETGVKNPSKIVFQGMARPQRMGYVNRGGKSKGNNIKSDSASDLVKMLQKQINSGEKTSQDIARMIKSVVADENTHLKGASKKLKDLVSSKHDFISKIHKNLDSVTKEIESLSAPEQENPATSFGVVPIRKMINGIATSMASVHDMVEKLEACMVAVGINPTATSETDMFREIDARIGALTNDANHKACMEMRKVMENVEAMLARMETMMSTHTSALNVSTSAHERTCVDGMEFDIDDFDDEFTRAIRGGEVVETVEKEKKGMVGEIYAEYHSNMKKTNAMYKTLKGNYEALVKDFQSFQVKTLKEISDIAVYKSKTTDARNLVMVYKKLSGVLSNLNKEGMHKIERALQDLEVKINQFNHERHLDRQNNINDLTRLKDNLTAISLTMDVDGSLTNLEYAVTESDTVLEQLREQRVKDLSKVSETFRLNLEELRKTFSLAEERKNAQQNKLRADKSYIEKDDSSSEINRGIYANYTSAIDRYHDMADKVDDERKKLIQDAKIKELETRERAEKAKIERQTAIQEHKHLQTIKRYGDIIRGEDEAKRKKLCKGTHVADSITVRKLTPMPQILVVEDHFRKAKIMAGVPEKHIKDMRASIQERWIDFVNNMFPVLTVVDNHGVKTGRINDEMVMNRLVLPFMKIRYGLKTPKLIPSQPSLTVKDNFNILCDEFVTNLLLHAKNEDYKHLLFVFKKIQDE